MPTFNVGGWYDIFLSDTIANFQAMRQLGRPTKLLIGPWTHTAHGNPVGEVNFGFGSTLAFINLRMDSRGCSCAGSTTGSRASTRGC